MNRVLRAVMLSEIRRKRKGEATQLKVQLDRKRNTFNPLILPIVAYPLPASHPR